MPHQHNVSATASPLVFATEEEDLFADYKPSQMDAEGDLFAVSEPASTVSTNDLFAKVQPVPPGDDPLCKTWPQSKPESWQILIVDDDEDVHEITHFVLGNYLYQNQPLTILSARSATEAMILLKENPYIAMVFLDVVMETHDAGLQLVQYIRETLNNRFIRIILRTGQPGYAPEEEVIVKYEIDDYANKTDLSRQKLITLTVTSLRTHANLMALESYRQHLEDKVSERTLTLQNRNEELRLINHQLIKLNQEKNEFLGIAAHDLKNPLSAIQGLADLIRDSCDEGTPLETALKEILECAQMIALSSQQMYELVTNLLDVNVIESGKLKVSLRQLLLRDQLQAVMTSYLPRAKAKDISLQWSLPAQFCLIWGDQIATRQIWENLISNAIKYSPFGTTVTVCLTQTDSWVRCEIRDQGPGLSEADQQNLFGKFNRLTPRPTANEHSTGLGLFIVKKLVEAMNGKVWCESELDNGCKFVVEFPVIIDPETKFLKET